MTGTGEFAGFVGVEGGGMEEGTVIGTEVVGLVGETVTGVDEGTVIMAGVSEVGFVGLTGEGVLFVSSKILLV